MLTSSEVSYRAIFRWRMIKDVHSSWYCSGMILGWTSHPLCLSYSSFWGESRADPLIFYEHRHFPSQFFHDRGGDSTILNVPQLVGFPLIASYLYMTLQTSAIHNHLVHHLSLLSCHFDWSHVVLAILLMHNDVKLRLGTCSYMFLDRKQMLAMLHSNWSVWWQVRMPHIPPLFKTYVDIFQTLVPGVKIDMDESYLKWYCRRLEGHIYQ